MMENNHNERFAQEEAQPERTFTQAELNAIVQDRLTRERTKYADYEELKGKAAQADERASALQQQIDTMNAQRDLSEMKQRVSSATGVPVSMLTFETEEACTKQAQEIKNFAGLTYPVVQSAPSSNLYRALNEHQERTPLNAFSRDNKHKPKTWPPYNY